MAMRERIENAILETMRAKVGDDRPTEEVFAEICKEATDRLLINILEPTNAVLVAACTPEYVGDDHMEKEIERFWRRMIRAIRNERA